VEAQRLLAAWVAEEEEGAAAVGAEGAAEELALAGSASASELQAVRGQVREASWSAAETGPPAEGCPARGRPR
jgi:hypothetical protein